LQVQKIGIAKEQKDYNFRTSALQSFLTGLLYMII
jgi:hypothetical protein